LLRVLKTALERVPAVKSEKDGSPKNLWEDWLAGLKKGEEPEIEPAGSGSDFAVFLHHLSRPVVDISLSGNRGGQYHTNFDDFAMVERYLDPGFVGHEMCGTLIAELLAEMANQGPSCFDTAEAAEALAKIAERAGALKDPGSAEPWLGAERAQSIAKEFQVIALVCKDEDKSTNIYEGLAAPSGIPGREWYRNAIWTPGLEDGYGSEFFPLLHAGADGSPRARFDDVGFGDYLESARYLLGLRPAVHQGR
jgi:N-acetylated-alpha-linked acidic dipeptidase